MTSTGVLTSTVPLQGGEALVGKPGVCDVLPGLRVQLSQAGLARALPGVRRGDGMVTSVGTRGKRVLVQHEDGADRYYNTVRRARARLCRRRARSGAGAR